MQIEHSSPESRPSKGKWILIGFLAVAGFFLFPEHQAHVLGVLPYVLLLACPLMTCSCTTVRAVTGMMAGGIRHECR
jgi:hypothetical protein